MSDTPRTDAEKFTVSNWKSAELRDYEEAVPICLAKALERELSEAKVPVCVGPPIIGILAETGQWISSDGVHAVIAADGLFQQDPYKEIATLRTQLATMTENANRAALSADRLASELKEAKEDERWIREMLADYRISFDDHPVGRRLSLNQFIHDLRTQLASAERREQDQIVLRKANLTQLADKDREAAAMREALEKAQHAIHHLDECQLVRFSFRPESVCTCDRRRLICKVESALSSTAGRDYVRREVLVQCVAALRELGETDDSASWFTRNAEIALAQAREELKEKYERR